MFIFRRLKDEPDIILCRLKIDPVLFYEGKKNDLILKPRIGGM